MSWLNTICFTVCMICIAAGTVLALAMVWVEISSDVAFKSWITLAIIGLASAMVAGTAKMLERGKT